MFINNLNLNFPKKGIFYLVLVCSIAQLLYILRYSINVLYIDQFSYIPLLNGFDLSHLLNQHNEHRLFFPKLLFLALARLSRWNVRVETVFNWIILQVSAVLLYCILRKNVLNKEHWKIGLSLCFFLVPQYWQNLLWGFQNCLHVSLCAALAALYFLTFMSDNWMRLHAAAFCCFISSYSFASGLCTWLAFFPLVVFTGCDIVSLKHALSKNRYQILYWACVTIFIFVLYFYNFVRPTGVAPYISSFADPGIYFAYFFSFLSAAFLGTREGTLALTPYMYIITGWCLCGILIIGCIQRLPGDGRNLSKVCLAFFVVMIAAGTALARLQYEPYSSITSRYREYGAIFVVVLTSLALAESSMRSNVRKPIFLFLSAGMVFGGISGWMTAIFYGRSWQKEQEENRRVLISFETASNEQLRHVIPYLDHRQSRARLGILKGKGYNIFNPSAEQTP